MLSECETKNKICRIARRMYEKGFVAGSDGNISVRLGDGRFLCTPTGVSKGYLSPEMICAVDAEGRQIAGELKVTTELGMHLTVYSEREDVNAVAHAHPPHATAFAVAGVDLPTGVLPEVELFIGPVPIAEYATPGTRELAEKLIPHLRNKVSTILLANHGAVAWDVDLEQAYFHIETLEMYCKILILSSRVGTAHRLSESDIRKLLEIKKSMGIADPRI